jgi:hypothetical protein
MHVYCSAFVHQLFGFHILLFQGNRVTVINAITMTDMALCGANIMVDGRSHCNDVIDNMYAIDTYKSL